MYQLLYALNDVEKNSNPPIPNKLYMVGKPVASQSLVHAYFFDITSRTKDIMGHSFLRVQYILYVFLHKYGNGLNQFFSSLITLAICTALRESRIREIRQRYALELFTGQCVTFSDFSNSGFSLRSANSKVHTSFPTWSKASMQYCSNRNLLWFIY